MRLIPVGLRIENVAPDSWLKITFLTPGAEWSIGNATRDGLGFSCNARDLLGAGEVRFQYLEMIGPSLAVKTAQDGGATSLEFTLCASIPDGVDLLEAYCEFDDETNVFAEFGDLKPQTWKCGRNSALVASSLPDIRKVRLFVTGAKWGELVRISLKAEGEGQSMSWCFGPTDRTQNAQQEALRIQQDSSISTGSGPHLPLSRMQIGASDIELELAGMNDSGGGSLPEMLVFQTYVLCVPQCQDATADPIGRLLLRADCSDDVLVIAQCGYQRPQYVTPVYKPFEF